MRIVVFWGLYWGPPSWETTISLESLRVWEFKGVGLRG